MNLIFKPGTRTYILSAIALVSGLLLQAHAQGVLELAPLVKLTLTFILTVVLPLVPVAIRKAIAAMNAEAKAAAKAGSRR
jgi:Na+/H+-dicarboxylate symporter